jgi:hypothetical protein
MKHQRTIFHTRVVPVQIPQKAQCHTLCQTCVFTSGGICGSRTAFRCIRGVKYQCLFFLLGCAWCGFHKKSDGTRYTEYVFLHSVGSVGHIVHSGVSSLLNIDALFSMLEWERYGFHKKRVGTCYAKLVFFASGGIYVSRSTFQSVQGVKRHHTIFMLRWAR